jgi:ribosomal protein S18 acetylase RimI-like enzyme
MSDLIVSALEQRYISGAARVLSLAMLSCPIHVAVFQGQDDEVRRVQEHMFARLLRHYPGLVFVAKFDGQIVGVLRMKSCHGRQALLSEVDEQTLQDTASRLSHWQAIWDQHDPIEPHWHLGPVGVVPSHQGSGVGTALMQRFCHEVDTRKAAAFLETDRSANVRFYQGFGFQVVDEVEIFEVRNYFMRRSPSD